MLIKKIEKRENAEGTGTCQVVYPNPGDFLLVPASASLPLVEPEMSLNKALT